MKQSIAVLIPHFNDPPGLHATLESLDTNLFLQIVIVDDGSNKENKPSQELILTLLVNQDLDFKLHLLYNEENMGVEDSLNKGLRFIKSSLNSKYILRVDCGDLCLNNRINKQYKFLCENKRVKLVGSHVRYVNKDSKKLFELKMPKHHEQIKKRVYVRVPFIHSAVLFKSSALRKVGMYSKKYKAAEDYAFFFEFIKNFETANLDEVLTSVLWRPSGISVIHRRRQLVSRFKLLIDNASLNFYFFYGLIRVSLLFIIPYSLLENIKKRFYK